MHSVVSTILITHLLLACVHASAASVTECCLLLQLRIGGGRRAKTVDSRQLGLEKVSSSVKWQQLVLPLCGILFVYRSVVYVLVPWAKLIDTSEMGMGSVPCNGAWQARAYITHNTINSNMQFPHR